MTKASGKVVYVLGNLIKVEFEGNISQGEICFVSLQDRSLKCEVIEIDGNFAKAQVFEDLFGIKQGDKVDFSGHMLEVDLGPGLLGSVFDGLQNPLYGLAEATGLYLERGHYLPPLDLVKKWHFVGLVKVGTELFAGDKIGKVREGNLDHFIMVPFNLCGAYRLKSIVKDGDYTITKTIAVLVCGDREESLTMVQKWPVKFPLAKGKRVEPRELLQTGMRVIDTFNPIVKGGTACTPGPFGAGKTVLQQCIAKFSNVDIVVVAACGERAGEVVEVLKEFPKMVDPILNRPLMDRTVIVCNTSSMPVAAREASVYFGMTVCEYYRQMGLDTLLLADSTSRWAQAMREISGSLEEIPGEEAFPAYLSSRISSFYERGGRLELKDGSVGSTTVIGAVSPSGGNFAEPVTQSTLNVVGNFTCLSRELSDRRVYPSIDPLQSWSRYLCIVSVELSKRIGKPWKTMVDKAKKIVTDGVEISRRIEVVGLEGISISDLIVHLKASLFSFVFLQQNAFTKEDAFCSLDQQIVQFDLVSKILDYNYEFKDVNHANSYFLHLSTDVKELNYLEFGSKEYKSKFQQIEESIGEEILR